MRKFHDIITKINFKKVAVTYIIAAIVFAIISLSVLSIVFREKIALEVNYAKISEKVENNNSGVGAVTKDLTSFADKSNAIVDILILDSNNKITFSAKNSFLAESGELSLTHIKESENKYLMDSNNPDLYFKLIKDSALTLTKAIFVTNDTVSKSYRDDYFYETNFNDIKVYSLSYVADKATGDKIYFISDIKPVENGEFVAEIMSAFAILFLMIYWVLIAVWVYANAIKSKLNFALWGIIALCTNIAGLLVYFIYKQNNQTCFKCGAVQSRENTFCITCGAKINETCPFCNSVIKENDSYCHHCGEKLQSQI